MPRAAKRKLRTRVATRNADRSVTVRSSPSIGIGSQTEEALRQKAACHWMLARAGGARNAASGPLTSFAEVIPSAAPARQTEPRSRGAVHFRATTRDRRRDAAASERAVPLYLCAGGCNKEPRWSDSKYSPMTVHQLRAEDSEFHPHCCIAQPVTVVIDAGERRPGCC